ncbi:hypothetical protein [Yinghuangia soli]|uniref:Tetratricopeptide repeat protein n=1 Tax=Yinghuangia soli TaxID=2908204 RepID=A0AA41Q2K1_9ACTN|nr:hypothetical protein [Yinghuangia soli]MCF2530408.1 hypothetical protein [Yinghuangia soli]
MAAVGFGRRKDPADDFWTLFGRAGELEEAEEYGELLMLADRLITEGAGYAPAYGEHMGHVHRYRVVALGELGRGGEAWEHFSLVLPQFLAAGPRSGSTVRVLRLAMGDFLLRAGHDAAAYELLDLALEECRSGWLHAEAVETDYSIAAIEVNAGRFAAAESRVRSMADRLAIVQVPEADRARIGAWRRWTLVAALNGQERFHEAERAAAAAQAAAVAHEGPGGDLGRNVRLARARALAGSGRAYEAEAECRAVLQEIDIHDRAYRGQLCVLRTVLGRAFTAQRRHDQAVADLEAAVAHGCASLGAGDPLTVDAALALAEARTARAGAGDTAEARRVLETAVREGEAGMHRGHPWLQTARERLSAATDRIETDAARSAHLPARPWKSRVQPGLRPCWDCGDNVWEP